jgi:hypothetical protein
MTVKNNKKIACLGLTAKDKIVSATKGKPKLITPFTKPPSEIAKYINRIEYISKFVNIC